ncbi:hypothetical protein RB594_003712 [Gaeumannomyces avenae]
MNEDDELFLGAHLWDGRYGPVTLALTREKGDLVQAHRLDLDAAGVAAVLQQASRLAERQREQKPTHVVSIIGPHRDTKKDGHTYLLTEHVAGDLEGIFAYQTPGVQTPPLPLFRVLVHGAARGVAQARDLGVVVVDFVLPEMRHIMVDNKGVAKVLLVPLLHDVAAGDGGVDGLPGALRTLPERVAAVKKMKKGEGEGVVDRREMLRGADVWLLGVLAVQCASGVVDMLVVGDEADEAEAAVARLVEEGESQGSAFEQVVPARVVKILEDEPNWTDFLRRCFTISPDQRPTVTELLDHPLFAPASFPPSSSSRSSSPDSE